MMIYLRITFDVQSVLKSAHYDDEEEKHSGDGVYFICILPFTSSVSAFFLAFITCGTVS